MSEAQATAERSDRGGVLASLFVVVTSIAYGASLTASRFGHQASADGYYHFAVARELARGHLRNEAHALPWTIFAELPVDHYFGFHLLLTPFAALFSPPWGIAIATVTLFCAVPLSVYGFLRARGVPFAWAWCFLPVLFANQDWRYLMLRGGSWLAALSVLFLHVAFFVSSTKARRVGIVLICYAATLSYQGALIVLPLHLGALASVLLLRRDALQRGQLVEPLYSLLGVVLGLLVNPYMDARGATFRFLWFHVTHMTADPAGLYPGLREFGPLPLEYLSANPQFILAPCGLLAVATWVLVRSARGKAPSYAVAVSLGAALVGLVLTVRAIRMREYSLPWATMFFALSTPPWPWPTPLLRRVAPPAFALGIALLLLLKWPDTHATLGDYLPGAQYRGARAVLAAHRGPPVLNIAEGDYTTLLWEDPDVVAVQGLSHYFLYPNRPVWDDVTAIRKAAPPARLQALKRFYARGVRLVTVQHRNSAFPFLERYPEAFHLVFRSDPHEVEKTFASSIYSMDGAGLDAAIARTR